MAARFGAKIVPFGAVGEDDLGQVSFSLYSSNTFPLQSYSFPKILVLLKAKCDRLLGSKILLQCYCKLSFRVFNCVAVANALQPLFAEVVVAVTTTKICCDCITWDSPEFESLLSSNVLCNH
jgi:hypothetical protein